MCGLMGGWRYCAGNGGMFIFVDMLEGAGLCL